MPKICYVEKRFSESSLDIIEQSVVIIEEYEAQGFNLTLRQLYYQFVSRDIFPDDRTWRLTGSSKWVKDPNGTKNADPNYKWLGNIVNDGRLAGMIDWNAIEDRARNLNTISSWGDPGDIIQSAANGYAIDQWIDQRFRVEVWVEKQALEAVVEQAAESLSCPSIACKGYMSQSEMWRAAQRFQRLYRNGQIAVIIHLGDHDPSGIDMTRDLGDRLSVFGITTKVDRIALNMDQIEEFSPPPNPAKLTDSRAKTYIAEFGSSSWELDALEPPVLRDLIRSAIKRYCDMDKLKARRAQQEEERKHLIQTSDNWDEVVDYLDERYQDSVDDDDDE